MNFTCHKCGETWEQDPGDLIECPVCGTILPRPAAPQAVTAMPATAAAAAAPRPAAAAAAREADEPKTLITPLGERTTRVGAGGGEGFAPPAASSGHTSAPPATAAATGGFSAPPPRATRSPGSAATVKAPGGGLAAEMQHMIGRTVGGYRIEGLLGVGGMGAVFLAHQISLDRKVALKLLPARFAANAELLARFTREALSAAQLNHHNIVQVYDVGSDGDTHYISMEFVRGDTLAGSIKKEGRLQLDDAAGYALQAARGLHFAHERGIIHRDIKPGNLMLNEFGIVKIADMGLAKMRGTPERPAAARTPAADGPTATQPAAALSGADAELTMHDIAMGTPSYMAPEQARDASSVDARADQYSLGCTLYYLASGRTPFSGNTAVELISKHQNEPPPPLETHLHNVPPAFAAIVNRMLAKRPEERYPTLADAVRDLEQFLGVETEKGTYSPREQHLAVLDRESKAYYGVAAARLRRIALGSFALGVPALIVVAIFLSQFALASGLLGLYALTGLANFIVEGLRTRNYLFRRVRAVFFGMPPAGWAKFVGSTVLLLAVLGVLGWLVPWLVFAVVGVGLAAGYQVGVIRRLRAERAAPIASMQAMLRELRLKGVSEEALHDFVARFSGADWEEFFEELFGYEPMLAARAKWATAEGPVKRRKFATWRDPLDRWLDGIEEARRAARERKQLAKVEAARLKAQGVTTQEAEKQAELEATRIIEQDAVRQFQEKEKQSLAQIEVRRGRRKGGLFALALRLVMLLLGLVIAYLGAAKFGLAPDPLGLAGRLGYPATAAIGLITGAAGLALLAAAFSAHFITRGFILTGALLIGLAPQLGASQPLLLQYGWLLGAALATVGVVFNVLALLSGKRW